MQNETERKISLVVASLEAKGRSVPRALSDIPDFPYPAFTALCDALGHGEVLLQRFSFHPNADIFQALAEPHQRVLSTAYSLSLVAIPVASIGLGYFLSWWFLLGIPLVLVNMSAIKKLYTRVIFRSALSSELLFCFLYYCGQISVTTRDNELSYYWAQDADGRA